MRLRILAASATLGVGAVLASGQAFADGPAQMFGHQGHLVISNDANIGISNISVSGQPGSTTTFVLRPAADYFVIPNLSIGGFIPFQYSSTSNGGPSETTIGIGARAGYDLALADMFSFWPRAGFSFASISESVTVMGASVSQSNSALTLNIFAPFLVHPAEHFFLGLGPNLDVDLTGNAKTTDFGLQFIIGGYFLGD